MIKHLKLHNFKSHRDSSIPFANLTVFSGANGVGKSSIFQSLLVLRESYLDKANTGLAYLNLKTDAINLGFVDDVTYQFSDDDLISASLDFGEHKATFRFKADTLRSSDSTILYADENGHEYDAQALEVESLFNRNCQYISAARLGPQETYAKNDAVVAVRNQMSVESGKAEYCIHFLNHNRNRAVLEPLRHPDCHESDLFTQTSFWEREISANVNVIVKDVRDLGYELRYQFTTEHATGKTQEFKAGNVGYGLTYALPIIVALLSASPGSVIFIENPEAHLHPAGQAKLAELICLAAQAGIQVVIETHSDHIINGILVQIKHRLKGKAGISMENVALYQVRRDEEMHKSCVDPVIINEHGRIISPPSGFYEQFSIDRRILLEF